MKKITNENIEHIFRSANICRLFETKVYEEVKTGGIKIPVYLSAGQEYIPCTIAEFYSDLPVVKRQIFIQHRGHSTYLSFGGNIRELVDELLGKPTGCSGGKGGSASIQSRGANIYGHDGLMGSQGPIAVGSCYANNIKTIVFVGDAAAEEDYFLAALGWASTKNLPIVFVIEDNNLSILTEKKVRRNWEMADVGKAMGLLSFDIEDDPSEIWDALNAIGDNPGLLNIKTTRLFWHAGAGKDSDSYFDRHKRVAEQFSSQQIEKIFSETNRLVRSAWINAN
jgi:TPP-dependent pyruvate/acetoin dehydrogenase alpha subunit